VYCRGQELSIGALLVFSHCCTAQYYNGYLWDAYPSKVDLWWGILTQSNTLFLGPTQVFIPNGISISSAIFAQLMAECPNTSQWAVTSPKQKLPNTLEGSAPPSNKWFLGPTLLSPNGTSTASAVFAGPTNVTNRQTVRYVSQSSLKEIWHYYPHSTFFFC